MNKLLKVPLPFISPLFSISIIRKDCELETKSILGHYVTSKILRVTITKLKIDCIVAVEGGKAKVWNCLKHEKKENPNILRTNLHKIKQPILD